MAATAAAPIAKLEKCLTGIQLATPTLVLPAPLRRVIGNLSHERVMVGMQLMDLLAEAGQ